MLIPWLENHTMIPNGAAGLDILVVEDNEDCAESTATLLRLFGHSVSIAADGTTALEVVRAGAPDVVLIDLGLPGMNGCDLARQLRASRSRKRVFLIAVTGHGQEEDKRRCAEAGIDLHLLKPVLPAELMAVLSRFKKATRAE
jgi:CheY-like chemotaxis protein